MISMLRRIPQLCLRRKYWALLLASLSLTACMGEPGVDETSSSLTVISSSVTSTTVSSSPAMASSLQGVSSSNISSEAPIVSSSSSAFSSSSVAISSSLAISTSSVTVSSSVAISSSSIAISSVSSAPPMPPEPTPAPPVVIRDMKIEAESFTEQNEVRVQSLPGGGENIGYIDAGDYLVYSTIEIPVTGEYAVTLYASSPGGSDAVEFVFKRNGNNTRVAMAVPATGGWPDYEEVPVKVSLDAGTYTLRVNAKTGGFNMDWFTLAFNSAPGRTQWAAQCDSCHGDQGLGGFGYPAPLNLAQYASRDALIDKIFKTMPPANSEVACGMQCATDLANYMLAGYPIDPADAPEFCNNNIEEHGNPPLRLLTSQQYSELIDRVFAKADIDTQALLAEKALFDLRISGFLNNAGVAINGDASDLFRSAEAIADAISKRFNTLIDCTISANCVGRYIDTYGRLLYRKAVSDTQKTMLLGIFDEDKGQAGIKQVTVAMLLSPETLYQYEEAVTTRQLLSPYALASRLSFLLWNSAPTDDLMTRAENGDLANLNGIQSVAEDMLNDSRAIEGIRNFYENYLQINDGKFKDVTAGEKSGANVSLSLQQASDDTTRFASYMTLEANSTFNDLMTSTLAYVDETSAGIYGVNLDTNADTFAGGYRAELNSQERSGLLTRIGFLIHGGGQAVGLASPTTRGLLVRNGILCQEPPNAPDAVEFPPLPEDASEKTWVQILKETHLVDNDNNPATPNPCVACHQVMDPLGFAFENYSMNGEFINQYPNGAPVDATGSFYPIAGDANDLDNQAFDNALTMAQQLGSSQVAAECFAEKWLSHALMRTMSLKGPDICALEALQNDSAQTDYTLRDLLMNVVSNESFRFRNPDATPSN